MNIWLVQNEMQGLVNNRGEDDPVQEEISEEEKQMKIMTKVLRGQRSGHVKGMGCCVIPTPLSHSQMCSFTQFYNREYILTQQATEKLEKTQSELQETKVNSKRLKANSKRP
jgi:hypothetical protein